ncbi:hypothetical protein Gotri_026705, partial [Gossypium trilobum]|nr:hypothetical protein [Gossypium trilobum]
MKLVELRLSKLISAKTKTVSMVVATQAATPRVLRARARLPITTLVLDISKGCPAGGIDLRLEMSKGGDGGPSVGEIDIGRWVLEPYSTIDIDEH